LQHWADERGSDGFVLFEALPGPLDLFVDKIIPIRRGVCFAPNEGETFRENLGLSFPVNRYTAARRDRSAA
jgi:hypothetical protein